MAKKNLRRRRMGKKKNLVPKAIQPHYHVKRVTIAQENVDAILLNNTDVWVGKAYETTLTQISNLSELVALYDSYRITAIKYQFVWNLSGNTSMQNISTVYSPCISYFYDRDDAITPNDTEFRERASAKMRRLVPGKVLTLVDRNPTVANEVYSTTIAAGYSQLKSPRIDIANSNVAHYGLKALVTKAPIDLGKVLVRKTLYVTCYGKR